MKVGGGKVEVAADADGCIFECGVQGRGVCGGELEEGGFGVGSDS